MWSAVRNNTGYILTLALWSIVGMLSVEASIVVILVNLILFFNAERYFEALFGMFFLFVLSDNREDLWAFAKAVKPFYLLLFGIMSLMRYDQLIKYPTFVKRFTLFLIVALVCLIYSPNPFVGVQKALSYALLLIVIPNIVLYEYRRIGKAVFANLVAFSIIIHFISIAVLITFPDVGMSHGGRWQGAFGNPNGLGLFLIVFYILYSAVKIEFPGIFTKGENIFYILITLMFLWMCGSRTAMLSIFVYEFVLFGFKYSRNITIVGLVAFLIYSDFIYSFFIGFLYDLGLASDLRLDSIEEGSGRVIAWAFAWEEIKESTMLIGKGLGYDESLMRSNAHMLSRLGHEGGVHNSYLIIWLNTGAIGLLLFLYAYLSLFIEGIRKTSYGFPLLCAVAISANYEPWITSSLNPYTCILLIIFVLMLKIDDDEKERVDGQFETV